MCFISNDKRISDNNTYIERGIGQCEMQFYEISRKFNILCNKQFFDLCAVDIYYDKYSNIKYNMSPIEKSDKNHNNKEGKCKYCIEKVDQLNRTLNTHIIRKKEPFFLHHIFEYFKEL